MMTQFASGGAAIRDMGNLGGIISNRGGLTIASSDSAVITAQTIGTARNNFDGSVGFRFTVGGASIVVTSLGRWVISGNSQTHVLRIFATPMTSPGELGNVTINTSGAGSGAYLYGTLSSPITLSASTTYAISSDETNGGDQWGDSASVTANAVITVNESVFRSGLGGGSGNFGTGAGGSVSYVPPNFKYH